MSEYKCPKCESTKLLVYEETSFELNGMKYFCQSVKAHDSDAKVICMDCNWQGQRGQFGVNDE
jgi:hypothetical protein